jgi:hypothetical protein
MDTPKTRTPERPGESARRPYERPAVAWEEDFTPYAFSACGKHSGTAACTLHRSS